MLFSIQFNGDNKCNRGTRDGTKASYTYLHTAFEIFLYVNSYKHGNDMNFRSYAYTTQI
jgi:hypothetical protein